MFRTVFICLVLFIIQVSLAEVFIESIFTSTEGDRRLEGSFAGGTRLWIFGTGFSADPTTLQNGVFIGNTSCQVIDYLSLPGTLIVADTPLLNDKAFPDAVLTVQVGDERVVAARSFKYMEYRTPQVYSVIPSISFPTSVVRFKGNFRDRSLGTGSGFFRTVQLGERYHCLFPDSEVTDQSIPLYSAFDCSLPSSVPIGYHNVSVTVGRYYGHSSSNKLFHYFSPHSDVRRSYKTTLQGEVYDLQVAPYITNVSHHSGSLEGGLSIQINGMGLEGPNLVADIDGVACQISSRDPAGFWANCTTGAPIVDNARSVYTGGRGVNREIFNRETNFGDEEFQDFDSREPLSVDILPSTETEINRGSHYEQRLQTIFIPKVSGPHTFFCVVDDIADVFISSIDNNSLKKTRILMIRGHTRYFLPNLSRITSDPMELKANERYLLEIHMAEFGGGDYLALGLSFPTPSEGFQHNSVKEVQKLSIIGSMEKEIQTVRISDFTEGTFRLEFSKLKDNGKRTSDFTTPLQWNASANEISEALRSLTTVDEQISVSHVFDEDALVMNFTFLRQVSYQRELIEAFPHCQNGCKAKSERLQNGSSSLGGKFSLLFGDTSTTTMDIRANTRNIETILESQLFSSGQKLTVDRYESTTSTQQRIDFFVTFNEYEGEVPFLLQVNISDVFGGIQNNTVNTESEIAIKGSSDLFFMPIPSNLLFTPEKEPYLHVYANETLASCALSSCNFQPSDEHTPLITSVETSVLGEQRLVEIIGSGFTENVEISAGPNIACELLSVSAESISCKLPSEAEAGTHILRVISRNKGLARHQGDQAPFVASYELTIAGVNPATGSKAGGTQVTLSGSGFSDSPARMEITVDGVSATILSSSIKETIFVTPPVDALQTLTGTVGLNELSSTFTFTYENSASLESISPAEASVVAQTHVILRGNGFGTNREAITVTIGHIKCFLDSTIAQTDSQISCILNGGLPGRHPVLVHIAGVGYASGDLSFNFAFEIDNISPVEGSIHGGTVLTLTGKGFGSGQGIDENIVSIGTGNPPCEVIFQNYTTVVCSTAGPVTAENQEKPLTVNLALRNSYASCSVETCAFTFTSATTPFLNEIKPSLAGALETVYIAGSGFGDSQELVSVFLIPISDPACSYESCPIAYSSLQNYPRYSADSLNSTHFSFTLQQQTAGLYRAVVYIEGKGYANSTLLLDYKLQIETITPTELSVNGGILTIGGTGFLESLQSKKTISVQVGSHECRILSSQPTELRCLIHRTLTGSYPVSIRFSTGERTFEMAHCKEENDCLLTFSEEFTPEILDGVLEKLEDGSVRLELRGEGFSGGHDSLFSKEIQDLSFSVLEANETTFITLLADLPAGIHDLHLLISRKGFATDASGILSALPQNLTADHRSLQSGSLAGGSLLEFSGSGFDSYNTSNNKVMVCNEYCIIASAEFDRLTCQTPFYVNLDWSADYGLNKIQELAGSLSSSSTSRQKALVDGNVSTFFISGNNCFAEMDFGPNALVELAYVRIHPEQPQTSGSFSRARLIGSQIQGSMNGIEYDTIHTIDYELPYGYSAISVETNGLYRFLRFRGSPGSNCRLAELAFYGIKYIDDAQNPGLCNITITVGNEQITLEEEFRYSPDLTGNVTEVIPTQGTAAGGTLLTFLGSNLAEKIEDVSVTTSGVPCEVQTASRTQVTCVTGPRTTNQLPSVQIHIANQGYVATNNVNFLYTERWSDSSTWGGTSPPREGDSVVIPEGKHVLLDTSPPQLYAIIIEGILEFEDELDIYLDCSYIFIRNGSLIVGTNDRPFVHKAVITLHGHPDTHPELPLYGAKNIAVRHGSLDLHGQAKKPTWTQLRVTAEAGESSLDLQEAVNWNVGDMIVIASTSFDFREAEELSIVEVSEDKKVLTIEPPLKFQHLGETFTFDHKEFHARAEVGVLTRNVVVQGDSASAELQWGAHVMLHAPIEGTTIGRLDNVEFTLCGQAFALGRYPIHFHLLGDVRQSYVRGCSIHKTFNRAVTFHGVRYFNVEENVAYNVMGHTFFLEDGIEERNRIVSNLGIMTKSSLSLLDTDTTPATFWITNPSNYFLGNHAAGSERYGFWFDLPFHPTGPSFSRNQCPPGKPLGYFASNQAHSNGRYGLRIFNHFVPREKECEFESKDNVKNPVVPALFQDFVSFRNKRSGVVCSLIGDVHFQNFTLADNLRAGIEVVKVNSPLGGASSSESLFIGSTLGDLPHSLRDDPDTGNTFGFIVSGATFNYTIRDTIFANYNRTDTFALGSCAHCNFPNNKNNDAKVTTFKNIAFTNSPNRVRWGFPYKHSFRDLDGTLSNKPGQESWITTSWPHLIPQCTLLAEEDGWPGSLMCLPDEDIVRFAVHSQQPFSYFENDPLWIKTVQKIPPEGSPELAPFVSNWSEVPYRGKKFKDPRHGWAIPVRTGYVYDVHWLDVDFTSVVLEASALLPDHSFYIHLNYTEFRDHFKVFVGDKEVIGSTLTMPSPTSQTGISYHDVEGKRLTILFSGRNQIGFGNTQIVRVEASTCPREGCPEPEYIEVERENFLRLWSNTSQWPGNRLPRAGENVEIEEPWRLVMNVQPPPLGNLIIKGQLAFSTALEETVLEASNILILGGELIAGLATLPFTKNATIRLLGDRSSVPLAVDEEVNVGPKALVVLGKLKLHGQRRGLMWTKLARPIYSSQDTVSLALPVDWQVGEEILITSSSHDQSEAELARILRRIDDQTFQLDKPVRHTHYGFEDPEALFQDKKADVRAEVGLLSRNIRITASETPDRFGFHLWAGKPISEDRKRIYQGEVQLSGVELFNGGHYQTARSALNFVQANGNRSYVEQCSFHHNHNTAILLKKTSGIRLHDNVVYKTVGSSIDVLESDDIHISGNLACLVHRRVNSGGNEVFEALGNFMICTWDVGQNKPTRKCQNTVLKNNVAAGSLHISFALHGYGCDDQAEVEGMNVAHSSRVGVLGFATETDTCVLLSHFLVHLTVEAGITLNSKVSRVLVEDVVLANNRVGISLLPANGEDAGETEIRNALVIGNTWHGGCGYIPNGTCIDFPPSQQTVLGKRNDFAKPGDQLMFSGCGHRVGIMMSVSDSVSERYPRSVPLKLFNEVKSDAGFGGLTILENVSFQNWTAVDSCGFHNSAMTTNPSASDASPIQSSRTLEFKNCDEDALVFMDSPQLSWINPTDCVDMNCTGLWNTAFLDEDGSLLSIPGQIVPNYAPAFEHDDRCELKEEWNAFVCKGTSYDILFIESQDVDRYTRRVHPVNVSRTDQKAFSILNSYMDRRWDDDYTSLLRLSRFPVFVQRGEEYNIDFTGTVPRTLRFGFGDQRQSNGVVVHVKYESPELHHIFNDGQEISATSGTVTVSDNSGAHYWKNADRTLSLVIKKGFITVHTINSVQVSLTLRATVDEFYDQGGTAAFVRNIAFTLGIPMTRIRVIDVVPLASTRRRFRNLLSSQVSVDFAVVETSASITDSSRELTSLGEEINHRAAVNTLFTTPPGEQSFSLQISDVVVTLSLPPEAPCIPSCKTRTVGGVTQTADCVNGQCQCTSSDYTYIKHASIDDLLNENTTAEADGCYLIPDSAESGINTTLIIAIACAISGAIILGAVGFTVFRYRQSHFSRNLCLENSPLFVDDGAATSPKDRMQNALPQISFTGASTFPR